MPLIAAASKLEPNNQSPHIPALPSGSNMQGTLGLLVGRAAPLKFQKEKKLISSVAEKYRKPRKKNTIQDNWF